MVMGQTIRQIRDNCIRARQLMQRSRQQHFAVGAFNIDNQETLVAVCRAAQVKKVAGFGGGE
jgi:fructose-bisphosphate aldolase, class II